MHHDFGHVRTLKLVPLDLICVEDCITKSGKLLAALLSALLMDVSVKGPGLCVHAQTVLVDVALRTRVHLI